MKVTEKAYIVWHKGMISDHPEEGWPTVDEMPVTYAKSRGKAKSSTLTPYGFEIEYGVDAKYLDLKVKRAKWADKYLIDGVMRTRSRIESDEAVLKRDAEFDQMVIDNPKSRAYIKKGGYYYGSNYGGYTEREIDAGIYSIHDAVSHCKGMSLRDYLRPILITPELHNKRIVDKIAELNLKLV